MRYHCIDSSLPAFRPSAKLVPPTMPSADFCTAVRSPYDDLSLVAETQRRSPEVRPTAFTARPPNLPPRVVDDCGLRDHLLALSGRVGLVIRFLSIGPRLCSTLSSDPTSRRRPCASLVLRRHQAGQRTSTSKLSFILGTQEKPPAGGSQFRLSWIRRRSMLALTSDDGPRSRAMICKDPRRPGFSCPPWRRRV